jgi:hypothetical protein
MVNHHNIVNLLIMVPLMVMRLLQIMVHLMVMQLHLMVMHFLLMVMHLHHTMVPLLDM